MWWDLIAVSHLFWIVTLHYHHQFTIWKEAFQMIELSLMPFGKKIVNA
jgi:uncharacterized membrane protein YccF (DUF307 family)